MATETTEKPITHGELLSLATSVCANIQLMLGYAASSGTSFGILASNRTDGIVKKSFEKMEGDARRWIVDAIDKLDAVMQHLGDEMDAVDFVCDESSEATRYAFEAMRRYRHGFYGGDRINQSPDDDELSIRSLGPTETFGLETEG